MGSLPELGKGFLFSFHDQNTFAVYRIVLSREELRRSGGRNLKPTAIFLYLKYHFSNGCFYNYTINSLGKKTGLSRSCLNKYIPLFLERNWCRIHRGNLIFNSLHDKVTKRNKEILYIKNHNAKSILKDLEFKLLEFKNRQMEFIATLTHDLHNKGARVNKARLNLMRKYILRHTPQFAPEQYKKSGENAQGVASCSMNVVSKLFKCSRSTASRKVWALVEDKKILVYRRREVVCSNVSWHAFKKLQGFFSGYTWYSQKYRAIIRTSPSYIKIRVKDGQNAREPYNVFPKLYNIAKAA